MHFLTSYVKSIVFFLACQKLYVPLPHKYKPKLYMGTPTKTKIKKHYTSLPHGHESVSYVPLLLNHLRKCSPHWLRDRAALYNMQNHTTSIMATRSTRHVFEQWKNKLFQVFGKEKMTTRRKSSFKIIYENIMCYRLIAIYR